jgi:hypothetical protein
MWMHSCNLAPTKAPECTSDSGCSETQSCRNQRCVNPCLVANPCSRDAECFVQRHLAQCRCPSGLVGDPFTGCFRGKGSECWMRYSHIKVSESNFLNWALTVTEAKPECTHDDECPLDKACVSQVCRDPCLLRDNCGLNAICKTQFHRPSCICPPNFAGNPQIRCYKRKYWFPP